MDILVLVGSLRADSWTAQLAQTVTDLVPVGSTATAYAGLGELPHYDQDLDTDEPPAAVAAFRAAVSAADALVVATPEYNGSLPGVLKNGIDWASRPRGSAAIDGKPVAVLSVSPSPRGAQWAREDAVKILGVAGAAPLANSLGIASAHSVFSDGRVADPLLETSLRELLDELTSAEANLPAA